MSETAFYSPAMTEIAVVTPERPASGQSVGSITAIIDRIEEAIETETTSIKSDPAFDIRASNARKSRYLYELNRAMKGIAQRDFVEMHRGAILRLKEKLVANEAAILAHLSAVTEVAAIIQSAIERAETDGTYSTTAFQRA
jgi:hypothetical protein